MRTKIIRTKIIRRLRRRTEYRTELAQEIKMKLYAPECYKNFVCIADKYSHSCCVGGEIDIDEETADSLSPF